MNPAIAERVAMQAWPGLQTSANGRWRHRVAGGYTNRANSTTAISWSRGDDAFAGVEWGIAAARRHGADPVFQISDRAEFDAVREALERMEMREFSPTVVMALDDHSHLHHAGDQIIQLSDGAIGDWFESWWALTGGHDAGEQVVRNYMSRLPGNVRGATKRELSEVAAVGLGIEVEGGLYICAMQTATGHRRKGHASSVVSRLAATTRQPLVLAVEADNEPAMRVYERLGFVAVSGYRYYR